MEEMREVVMQIVAKAEEILFPERGSRTKNEIQMPDMTSLELNTVTYAEGTLLPLGVVQSYTELTLVIQSHPTTSLLDLDSTICAEDRRILGKVEDVFGSVSTPFYAVRSPHYLEPGAQVYFVQEGSKVLNGVKYVPGCDASNRYDEEVPQDQLEFSDDETESIKRRKKRRRRPNK